jgi:ubiquinone/menaquinone biosynthesis C-methylase UbiE
MNHRDHVALIQDGVAGAGPSWLELGGGDGAFTLALADVLAGTARITGVDRDARALAHAAREATSRFPGTRLDARPGDFTDLTALPTGPFDGVLAANSLHFVPDRTELLAAIIEVLRPDGRLVVVEYDADRGNPWVPHPFAFATWVGQATEAGLADVRLLHRVPSRFLGAIYGAVAIRPG